MEEDHKKMVQMGNDLNNKQILTKKEKRVLTLRS
jgi:hypothetical protein